MARKIYVEVINKTTGESFIGPLSKVSVLINRNMTYLSHKLGKNVFEDDEYKWRYANPKVRKEKKMTEQKKSVLPRHIVPMLRQYGNTVISEKNLKRLGGKEKVEEIVKEESGLDVAIKHVDSFYMDLCNAKKLKESTTIIEVLHEGY